MSLTAVEPRGCVTAVDPRRRQRGETAHVSAPYSGFVVAGLAPRSPQIGREIPSTAVETRAQPKAPSAR